MPVRDLICDVGMNNGDDTAYYLSLGFRTVAIEANPELVEQAKSRFAREISAGRLFILNIGIADREGQLPFWICDTISRFSSFNRAFAAWDNSAHHQIQVPCSRFKTILDKFGVPYFCKIDIQGSEPFCLEDLEPHNVPTFISVEVSNLRELEMALVNQRCYRFSCPPYLSRKILNAQCRCSTVLNSATEYFES
jgi:FkbM family methyltransferase